jgi:radical SAM protein with 4Fe4S-binding SPASM domain
VEYRIDGHKLLFHPRRVADWLEGKDIAPLYMEISPSGACNHRCSFCALDFMGYRPRFLPADMLCRRLEEMGDAGLKAVMFAGEGEPLLHREIGRIATTAKAAGIDAAFTTNAVNLREGTARALLPVTTWIKVSCNAGKAETYARVHGTQADDFYTVLKNMESAVRLRKELGSSCTLGFQMVLLPENQDECVLLAKKVCDLGADYLVIKPFTPHPQSLNTKYSLLSYENLKILSDQLNQFNTASFSVIFRYNAISILNKQKKIYNRCHALHFMIYIDSGGDIYGCSAFLNNKHFYYGNILELSFKDIMTGSLRRESHEWCRTNLDVDKCRINCRMEQVNRYLWELLYPSLHVNFI